MQYNKDKVDEMALAFRYLTIFFIMPVLLVQNSLAMENNRTRFQTEIELGPVWQTVNDVQIPNTQEGTRFSLVDLVGRGPFPAGRLYFTWNITERHGLRLLLAPLATTQEGVFDMPVDFAGVRFEAGVSTDATYKFNSYRLCYRYLLFDKSSWSGWLGFTAKIRDAKIELQQQGKSSKKTDLGFVPLLHLAFDYRLADGWCLVMDLDALAGGPGRAEDFALKVGYDFNERWRLALGYRTVEGGADVEEVYNFAWLHYAVLSVQYGF
jgi:hypothetical protein